MSRVATLRRKLAAARRLSASDWRVIAEAALQIARAELLVRARPYAAWRGELDAPAGGDAGPADPRLIALFETAAGNQPWRVGCLPRAIALRALLARRGYAAEIRFGVRRDGAPPIDGHAWVEVGGHPAETRSDARDRYAPFEAAGGRAA